MNSAPVKPYNYTVRQSGFVLVFQLFAVQLAYMLVIALFFSLTVQSEAVFSAYFLLALLVLNIITLFYIALRWYGCLYSVAPQFLGYRKGIIVRKTTCYDLRLVQGVSLEQSSLGRFTGYGNLKIFNTTNKDTIVLRFLPQPEQHLQNIERNITILESENSEMVMFA